MANNLDSNITRKVIRIFLEKFEAARVVTRAVDTQLLAGKFTPSAGDKVDFKRPHDYRTHRTPRGDLTSETKSDIISGKATGTVQDYFTVATEWENFEEALQLDQLDQILEPAATRIVTDLEVDLVRFMGENTGLIAGTPDTPVTQWSHVAEAGALLHATGVPTSMEWFYVMNPFTNTALADTQSGLASGENRLVTNAWEMAQISTRFGGLRAMSSNALKSRTSSANTDRAGTLAATPDGTYLTAKDTMTQALALTALGAGSETLKAGDIVDVEGRNRLNLATREVVVGADGNPIRWSATITADVAMVAGAATVVVTGPGLQEVNGQYNTVDTALTSGDVINILGTASKVYQPNLFFHKQAFGIGTVKLPKLFSTDTIATTRDGFSIRVSKYSDGDKNLQKIRFDLLPAFAVFNPFFAGQGFGVAP